MKSIFFHNIFRIIDVFKFSIRTRDFVVLHPDFYSLIRWGMTDSDALQFFGYHTLHNEITLPITICETHYKKNNKILWADETLKILCAD